jgi:hypothetical protein
MDGVIPVDELTERFRLAAEEWAARDGEACRLEEMKKIIFSELVNQSEASSVAAREHEAYANTVYRSHIDAMVTARSAANVAKAKMQSMQMKFEMWRTKNATRRAEIGIR